MHRMSVLGVVACALVVAGLACCPPTLPRLPLEGEGGDAATAPAPSPPPPGQAPAVRILSGSYYYSITDSLWFVGELENTGDADLSNVRVTIALQEAGGDLLAVETGYVDLEVVRPGEVAPFQVLFSEGPRDWDDYEVTLEADPAESWNYAFSYRELEAGDHSGQGIEPGGYRIVGRVQNTGSEGAEYVKIIATLYNARGEVVGVGSTYSQADRIPPGGRSPFEIELYSMAGPVDRYTLVVEGAVVDRE